MTTEATVPFGCESCAGGATFGEMVVDGRLHWSLSHVCPAATITSCGRDEPPAPWRAALLEQCGVYRLRIGNGPSGSGPVRGGRLVAAMRVLRQRRGTPMREIPAIVELLQGEGLTGTEAELRLLAAQFAEAGVDAEVRPGT